MNKELADRLLRLLRYIDAINIEPAGPSRNRDLFLVEECEELTKIITFATSQRSYKSGLIEWIDLKRETEEKYGR